MRNEIDRRSFLELAGLGVGAVFASGIAGCRAASAPTPARDFYFLHLSDTHWGFAGAPNPESQTTLRTAVAAINALSSKPDFIAFTGDLTQTTDDGATRRRRMREFRSIVAELDVKDLRFLPGEHDASLDQGEAFREAFGETHWSFDHGGVHFLALDNVSDPSASLGDAQLEWMRADLAEVERDRSLVVLAHRPLFDLYPPWDWYTKDGARALEVIGDREATVLYGHVHQEHHHVTGRVAHHAARSLIFPLPAPGSVPKKAPLPWDAAAADHGIGFRVVEARPAGPVLREVAVR